MEDMTLGTAVRTLRQSAGFSQRDFAGRVGVSPSYLSLIEADKREASIPLLRRMAETLGTPATILFAAALASGMVSEGRDRELSVIRKLVEAARLNLLQEQLTLGEPAGG